LDVDILTGSGHRLPASIGYLLSAIFYPWTAKMDTTQFLAAIALRHPPKPRNATTTAFTPRTTCLPKVRRGSDGTITLTMGAMRSRFPVATVLTATLAILGVADACAEDSAQSAADTASGVAAKVGKAIERGAKAAASGVERGVNAAANGVRRGAEATTNGIERGAEATGNALNGVAKKVGISPASSPASGK